MDARSIAGTRRRRSTLEVPARGRPASPSSASNLCSKCLELPLEDGLKGAVKDDDKSDSRPRLDITIANVGDYYRRPSATDCDLCRLLCDSRITVEELSDKPKNAKDGDELRAFNVFRDNNFINPWGNHAERRRLLGLDDSRYLAVVPSGSDFSGFTNSEPMAQRGEEQGFLIFRRRGSPQAGLFPPRTINPRFDVSLAKTWLEHCERHHRKSCSRDKRNTNGLRLINCHSSTVGPSQKGAKYLALSYVWGPVSTGNNPAENVAQDSPDSVLLPTDLPAVVSDAMKVTTRMGFEFLWVDKYCINQNDMAEKHGQISQMDSIYYNAEAAIIAAAGSDSSYGLPGIDHRSRQTYPSVTSKDISIVSTLRNPQLTIQSSKWSTRGWTLQEAVLSRRCIVFTDDQVYFECKAMNCHESVSTPLGKLHVEGGSKFRSVLRSGIFGRSSTQKPYGLFDQTTLSLEANFYRFCVMIQQYTERELSDESDSLNAFSGIIRDFEIARNNIGQIYGIPTIQDDPGFARRLFLNGLAWYHESRREDHKDESRPRRRESFPSWSWAGWAGKAMYKPGFSPRYLPLETEGVDTVSIETKDRVIFELSIYAQGILAGDIVDSSPTYIRICAPLVPPSLFSYDGSSTPPSLKVGDLAAKLCLSIGPWDPLEFKASLEEGGSRQCIYWGRKTGIAFIMVLESQGEEAWSRVGLMLLDDLSSRTQFEEIWSGVRRWGPDHDRWVLQRPTDVFRVI